MNYIEFLTPDLIELLLTSLVIALLSAFCSLSEASIVALTEFHIQDLFEKKNKKGFSLKKIIQNKPKYLSSIIMLNTIVNIGGSMYIGSIAIQMFDAKDYFYFLLSLTIIMLLFSEIKPKVYAAKNPALIIKIIYKPILFCAWILTPVVNTVNGFLNNNSKEDELSIAELNYFVSNAAETGLIKKDEASIIRNVMDIRKKTSDMFLKDGSICFFHVDDLIMDKKDELLDLNYRRIILVNKDQKPVGMFFKDEALKKIILNESNVNFSSIMHPLTIVTKDCSLPVLAIRLQKSGSHLSVVTDDDGFAIGVVSLTDIKGLIFTE